MNRILLINNFGNHRGGAETVFLDTAVEFSKRGWLVQQHSGDGVFGSSFCSAGNFEKRNTYQQDAPAYQNILFGINAIWSIRNRRHIQVTVERFKPDVVHMHNIYHHLTPSILGPIRNACSRVVITLHDLKLLCPSYKMLVDGKICNVCSYSSTINAVFRRCHKRSFAASVAVAIESAVHRFLDVYDKNIDIFILPSRFYFDLFHKAGYPPHKLRFIPNFTPVLAPEVLNTSDSQPRRGFLYAGRLSSEKGILTLIRAAASVDVPLFIAGSGPQEYDLRKEVSILRSEVHFLGHLDRYQLSAEFSRSLALVLPSEWFENAPMIALEAMGAGLPVIAAQIGGIPEIVEHGVTGWVFPSGDASKLAQILDEVRTRSKSEWIDISRAAMRRSFEHFDVSIHVDRLIECYSEI